MSEGDDSQERTEDPTEKRKKESRERGQTVRSKELSAFLTLITGSIFIQWGSDNSIENIIKLFQNAWGISEYTPNDFPWLVSHFYEILESALYLFLPLFSLLVGAALISAFSIGGIQFYIGNALFKWERISPFSGLKRMFSFKVITEVLKSFLKFSLIFGVMVFFLWKNEGNIFTLGDIPVENAIGDAANLIGVATVLMVCSLIIVAGIDIPLQIKDFMKQLRMTKQEVKDEYKETEGKPEVKSKIRQMQQKIARARMMSKVPKADVIITNPTHYAVALQYEGDTMTAPLLVAKGVDLIAQNIIKIGQEANVPVVALPMLARSIYHTTDLDEAIPAGLYVAVAQVLAYVYQLKMHNNGKGKLPKLPSEVPIPDELVY